MAKAEVVIFDVPIPLRLALESPYPSDQEVLTRMAAKIRQFQEV